MDNDDSKDRKNGYYLSRVWFVFANLNPEKINTHHCALWHWIIRVCNSLGWKEQFGLPTNNSKKVLGIKSYNTYKKSLDDLVQWGFISIIQKSANQHTANIISINYSALSKFDTAKESALSKNDEATESALSKFDSILNYKEDKPISYVDTFSIDYKPLNNFDLLAHKLWMQCLSKLQVLKIKPTTLIKAKPKDWADQIRLMIEVDKKTVDEIEEVLEFLKTDDFWSQNIRSTDKLRIKFEDLQIKARTPRKSKKQVNRLAAGFEGELTQELGSINEK